MAVYFVNFKFQPKDGFVQSGSSNVREMQGMKSGRPLLPLPVRHVILVCRFQTINGSLVNSCLVKTRQLLGWQEYLGRMGPRSKGIRAPE